MSSRCFGDKLWGEQCERSWILESSGRGDSLILHPEKGINDFPTDGHIHFTMITWFFAQYAFNKVMEKKAAEPVKPKEPPPMPTEWCLE